MAEAMYRVLVAEDDDALRECVMEIVEAEGWLATAARDGKEALAMALAAPSPDVIYLDHRMPALTGAEVARQLRDAGCDIPIIFCTAARDATRLLPDIGVICPLGKPFDLDALVGVVRSLLSRGSC